MKHDIYRNLKKTEVAKYIVPLIESGDQGVRPNSYIGDTRYCVTGPDYASYYADACRRAGLDMGKHYTYFNDDLYAGHNGWCVKLLPEAYRIKDILDLTSIAN